MIENTAWWRGSVIYQIYPRSFMDARGDGVGDLPGITSKLDYVAELGVDAIWISPFFPSPMKDFGYDVTDYRGVDPMFGSFHDFQMLLERAHELGLKVIIDLVLSHTSDQHHWFVQSRSSRDNQKADWYVWADPKPDGTPPNNWLSFFTGSAWTFDSRRRQYYLHNFLSCQPDLNFHNPVVRRAQLDNARFWLDMGVDGFRLDTSNFYFHSQGLENNPALGSGELKTPSVPASNPYAMQRHQFDISQPENLGFLRELRELMEEYPGTTTVGEISDDRPLERMVEYTTGHDRLHMAYTFDLFDARFEAKQLRDVIEHFQYYAVDAWPCWALSNHDVMRVVSRWTDHEHLEQHGPLVARLATVMLCSLYGSVCLYQGEELGLPEADVPYERLVDPYGLALWPEYKGRDGCRTPMPWSEGDRGGFSSVEPWLPVDVHHRRLCVDRQLADADSTLNVTRAFLHWRKAQSAMVDGTLILSDFDDELLGWLRVSRDQAILAVFNLTAETRTTGLPEGAGEIVYRQGFSPELVEGQLTLPPFQAAFIEIARDSIDPRALIEQEPDLERKGFLSRLLGSLMGQEEGGTRPS
ncbi:alpha-amylase family glycosyl hydrolase [Salinicola sp. JS01]|uniref:alpha-amylase family glycosyl hydrolase n=1 Tax=Salinicola sp. JS01 TaxID=3050071 RepID=UPI00255C1A69|nr:alpha-amylase family glycosyl hydrolase [Salinicola sp. JS01]WIX32258.1 alpha-amylase family glycosyl hydrolase [Salinicola sp. JS01]